LILYVTNIYNYPFIQDKIRDSSILLENNRQIWVFINIRPTFEVKLNTNILKPTLPKGTRDFLPLDIKKRDFIFTTIRHHFKLFGYDAIETPAMESLETLMGKYGDEGDRLLFKILNNGDYLQGVSDDLIERKDSQGLIRQISKRGLRYDLTVPFARFIVMNRQNIKFPFKRSAIQPVWRADKPQKGRYQEFYQCDADVAGSSSLYYEAELIRLYDGVFKALNMPVVIRWNNRKVLYGIIETAGLVDEFQLVTVVIDKLDKIGKEGVKAELMAKDFSEDSINTLFDMIECNHLEELVISMKSETGLKGIEEIKEVMKHLESSPMHNMLKLDATLARGLGYYTGCIFEVNAFGVNMGSIGGGGRYDNLTEIFGLKGVSGVGISFGVERIYDVMNELQLFPKEVSQGKGILISCIDTESFPYSIQIVDQLRSNNIACELYPEVAKLQKQMSFANESGFLRVALVGDNERSQGKVTLKNMETGNQEMVTVEEMISRIKEHSL
jgi:histidyl-tRNA synthetase